MPEIRIDVNVATKQAEERLKKLQNFMENMGDDITDKEKQDILAVMTEMEKFTERSSDLIEKIQQNVEDINLADRLKQQLSEAESALSTMRDQDWFKEQGEYERVQTLQAAREEIENIKNALSQLDVDKLNQQNERWNQQLATSDASLHRIIGKSYKLEDNIIGATQETKSMDKSARGADASFSRMEKSTKKMSSNLGLGLKSIVRYGLALFSIRSIYGALSRLSRQWLDSNDAAARQLKSNINAMSSALSNMLAPVLTYLGNLMATVMGYANAILKAFFGIDLFSKKTGKNVSKGIGGGMKKANKEMKKFTAGFDEAEVISSNIADNLDGAGGGGGGFDELPEPKIPEPDISRFLKAVDRMKKALLDIWNSDEFQKYMNDWVRIADATFTAIKSLSANLWDNILETWNLMLPNLLEGFRLLVALHAQMVSDVADTLEKWLPAITESINQFVDDVFSTFRPLFVLISEIWRDTWQIVYDLWLEYGAIILDKIGEFIDTTVKLFTKIWTHVIDPILAPAIEMMSDLWHDHLKDLIIELGSFVAELVIVALNIYNKFIAPVISFLLDLLKPSFAGVFGFIFGLIKSTVGGMIDHITRFIRTTRELLLGLADIVSGVFTANWAKAWGGVTRIIQAAVNSWKNIVKIPLNGIIDIVNSFIRGLNRIKIPNWVPIVGGRGGGIPTIPRLAEGAVLTQPTLNLAGEYPNARRNPEIVTPENKMREAMEDVLSRHGGGINGTIVVQNVLDGRIVSETVIEREELRNLQLNGGVV